MSPPRPAMDDFQPVQRWLQRHREQGPTQAALVDVELGRSLNFAELAAVVDRLAAGLLEQGVGRGDRILLVLPEGVDKLLWWLAIWRVGAVVCPLDAAFFGKQAMAGLLAAIAPRWVVCDDDVAASAWLGCGVTRIQLALAVLCDPVAAAQSSSTAAVDWPADSDPAELAAICATSGSSGEPKILLYDHACYWRNGLDSIDLLGLRASDRLLEYRSFNWFSAQILSLMPMLMLGMTLCLARHFSRTRFGSWVDAQRISVCAGVPAVLNMLLADARPELQQELRGLRLITSSSAPWPAPLQQRFERRFGVPVLNLYGASEVGWICGNRADDPGPRRGVGRPLSDVRLQLLAADGSACPPGQPGRVVVESAKMALARLHADGRVEPLRGTALALRDLALHGVDGMFEVVGREDDLINRGGLKILPQELESVLLDLPGVAEAAAIGVPDPIYGEQLVGFVVAAPGCTPDPAVMLQLCRQGLPREKCPASVLLLESLPRSARGKLERHALRQIWEQRQLAPA